MSEPELFGPVLYGWLTFFVSGSVWIGVLHLARWFGWGRFGAR